MGRKPARCAPFPKRCEQQAPCRGAIGRADPQAAIGKQPNPRKPVRGRGSAIDVGKSLGRGLSVNEESVFQGANRLSREWWRLPCPRMPNRREPQRSALVQQMVYLTPVEIRRLEDAAAEQLRSVGN